MADDFMISTNSERAWIEQFGLDKLDATTRRHIASAIRQDIAAHEPVLAAFRAGTPNDVEDAAHLEQELTNARALLAQVEETLP